MYTMRKHSSKIIKHIAADTEKDHRSGGMALYYVWSVYGIYTLQADIAEIRHRGNVYISKVTVRELFVTF